MKIHLIKEFNGCKKPIKYLITLILLLFLQLAIFAQTNPKTVNDQVQFWTSLNTTTKISEKWAVIADFHIRRNNFIKDPSFYLIRGAAQYTLKPTLSVAAGYAHMWIAPSRSDWQAFVNEHRIYQQLSASNKLGKTTLSQKVRNEQRWQQIIVDDKPSGKWRFTNRIRYLIGVNIPFSTNDWVPKLVLSEELHVHFGKPIVFNTFDQNRVFIGIKQKLSKTLSFDFGYMNVYQQKFSGYQYDMNHTIRLFFYLTPDLSPSSKQTNDTEHSNNHVY